MVGIVGRRFAKTIDADRIFLELIGFTRRRPLSQESEQSPQSLGVSKSLAMENPLDFPQDSLFGAQHLP